MFNEAMLIGNVGKDPEIKQVSTGSMARFSLATSESYKDKSGNWETKTEWHNVVFFGKIADLIASKVHKGSKVLVRGKIETRSFEKDGQKSYALQILGRDIKLLDTVKKPTIENVQTYNDNFEDIPF
ncbi:MAG: single-stranded DNA-binding protein [Burkholderiales bacterium]